MEGRVAAVAERWKWNDADTRARMHKEVSYGPSHLRLRLRATLQPLANMTVDVFWGGSNYSRVPDGPCTHQPPQEVLPLVSPIDYQLASRDQ